MHTVFNMKNSDPLLLNDTAISLENVSVLYRVPRERVSGIKEYTIRWLQRRIRYEQFWALNDISFDIKKGEVFGVIGRNGSGKSTLLKVIARVLIPTTGKVVLHGRVAPLLELGAGFHHELTGRENIYLNSALLGRSKKEVEQLLPEIMDFAEIGDFIDAPIRTYSTGMVARLGFSVATCVRPQILLVDEILSVGDAKFQQKCLDRMYSFQTQGTTVIIVSHSMATIESFCERAVWLAQGHMKALGSVKEVIRQYVQEMNEDDVKAIPSNLIPDDGSPTNMHLDNYKPLPEVNRVYPVNEDFNPYSGTISVWMKFDSARKFRNSIIFHTDESRFILYVGLYSSADEQGQDMHVLIARAGGNRRSLDTYFGLSSFPEVPVPLYQDYQPFGSKIQEDEWYQVIMTWKGYPEGKLSLYVNGILVGERDYDRRYDNGRPLARAFAVGMRPREWEGEVVQNEDGTVVEIRPETTFSISDGNLDIKDLRLYPFALSEKQIQELVVSTVAA
jgi:ABC-2 type transport system ATP-binding protein